MIVQFTHGKSCMDFSCPASSSMMICIDGLCHWLPLLELFCSWRYVSDPATACQAAAESTSYNIHNFCTFSMFVFGSLVWSIILISYTFGHSFPVTANQKQTSKYIKQIVQSITLISYIFDHSFPFVHQQVAAHRIMASSNQRVLK
jgi:hypothetical protein